MRGHDVHELVGFTQQRFVVVFVAIGTVASAAIAESILLKEATFRSESPEIFLFVVISTLLIHAPLLLFANAMYQARRNGLSVYGVLGQQLCQAFFDKWSKVPMENLGTELKSSGDASTMADYGATFETVHKMGIIPLPPKGALRLIGILLIPFFPLYFTEFSLPDLLERVRHVLI